MKEKKKVIKEGDFFPISKVLKFGKPVAMDIYLVRDSKEYIATVGTQEYLDDLIAEKEELLKDKAIGLDKVEIDPVLRVDDLNDIETIRKKILGLPFAEILPYLTPQQKEE